MIKKFNIANVHFVLKLYSNDEKRFALFLKKKVIFFLANKKYHFFRHHGF